MTRKAPQQVFTLLISTSHQGCGSPVVKKVFMDTRFRPHDSITSAMSSENDHSATEVKWEDVLLLCNEGFGGHLSGHVNTHIRSLKNPQKVLESQRDSPKLNVCCTISRKKMHGPFVFGEPIVAGFTSLDDLQQWLFPQSEKSEPDNSFGSKRVLRLTGISQCT
ncbi:uncharacterized protein TNCV_1542591 [Trichonephila clavipes]|nr:uncharacterized protein TNCV_1542591 [Trichonephila clavipes]